MLDPYQQFTQAERRRISGYLPAGEKAGMQAAVRGYLVWMVISGIFLAFWLVTKELTYGVAAYLSLLVPFIWGLGIVRKHYRSWCVIVQKFDKIIRQVED